MKTNHNNLTLIETWIDETGYDISLTDDFVKQVYHQVLEDRFDLKHRESTKRRCRGFTLQYDFVRRDLLKILHKRAGGSADNIRAGYVYLITNPAWPDFVKIGSSIDVMDRLNSYQTSSPLRDYKLEDYYFVWDRRKEEIDLHNRFDYMNNEWCKAPLDAVKLLFVQRKLERRILPEEDKIYEIKDAMNTKLNIKKCDWYRVLGVGDDSQ